ncbi:MAG TPA: hypothetical protein VMO47_03480, partial [Rhodothermales bacterium]|nr:hypothetical protein [Rhodothermales bacterium]
MRENRDCPQGAAERGGLLCLGALWMGAQPGSLPGEAAAQRRRVVKGGRSSIWTASLHSGGPSSLALLGMTVATAATPYDTAAVTSTVV